RLYASLPRRPRWPASPVWASLPCSSCASFATWWAVAPTAPWCAAFVRARDGQRPRFRPDFEAAKVVVDAVDAVDHVLPARLCQEGHVALLECNGYHLYLFCRDVDLALPVKSGQRLWPYS